MNIFDHGVWTPYIPAEFPAGVPVEIAAKIIWFRNNAGDDFYAYRNGGGFDAFSVKATCVFFQDHWRVMTATVDESRLVPENRRIIEIYDGDMDDPLAAYQHMIFDPETLTLSAPTPVVIVPTETSKLGLRRVFVEMGIWDQVKAHIADDPDTQEEWDLATTIKRSDTLTQKIIAKMQLTPAQVDVILIRQAQLV